MIAAPTPIHMEFPSAIENASWKPLRKICWNWAGTWVRNWVELPPPTEVRSWPMLNPAGATAGTAAAGAPFAMIWSRSRPQVRLF